MNNAGIAEGVNRGVVVAVDGTPVRGRATSTARTGEGQYQAIFDRDVRQCVYVATLGDESASGPGTGQIAVTSLASNVNGVRVVTRDSAGQPLRPLVSPSGFLLGKHGPGSSTRSPIGLRPRTAHQ